MIDKGAALFGVTYEAEQVPGVKCKDTEKLPRDWM